ncbi:hypothetical protein SAMN02745898_10945 [Streptomyces sp. 136MFCol5.1]|uniref:hypothetical protein n=1 Tax=Streptomyces sp. 136MFCol5.1 TaxID=1172182 RepID=UPI00088C1B7B|nr:hypothetical protein [Streptomyces sp. 136MFCol5.1]SCZ08766.1 hypothetical protein SAMN02745898_10945 [Streptomyces sp. 136MFCol5.1]
MSTSPEPLTVSGQLDIDGLPAAPEHSLRTAEASVERKSSAAGRPHRLVRPGQQHAPTGPGQTRQAVRWLHIVAPPSYTAVSSARSWCRCGYERTAKGRAGVLALVEAHTTHPEHCPLLGNTEGSKAA